MYQEDWASKIFNTSVELDITLSCNLRCMNCDRAIRHAPSEEHMSLEQIKKFVRETQELGWKWKLLKLIGGEPTLHPEFWDVINIMEGFHKENPQCRIQLWTNGHGSKVEGALRKLPEWIQVVNSEKGSIRNAFRSFNLAPIDFKQYKSLDFSKGCDLVAHCGLGLNRYGYYPCPAGGTVDRVFGFDIGVKNLRDYQEQQLWKKQLPVLCQYCGHFKHQFHPKFIRKEKISRSWKKAFERFSEHKPSLSVY